MFSNYLALSLRNLVKQRTFSVIKIGGLALSMASFLFVFFYLHDELTYDRFHVNAPRIFRITQNFVVPDNVQKIRFTHQKIGPYLKRVYPQIENYVRFQGYQAKLGKEQVLETGVVKADPEVFSVFTYKLTAGNPQTVLSKPSSIVLSKTLSKKYLVGEPLGQTLIVDGVPYDVTGVMEDVPSNSDKWISAIMSPGDFGSEADKGLNFMYDTYFLLKSPEDEAFIREQLPTIAAQLHQQAGQEVSMGYDVQALTDLHFFHGIEMDNPKGNKSNVYIFAVVAIVLLGVSVINFINLTTISGFERAKEVGVRKVTGANNGQLVRQFMFESSVAVFLSTLIAIVLMINMKQFYLAVSGKIINFSTEDDFIVIGSILSFLIVLIVTSSFYPAWVLASYKPFTVLRTKTFASSRQGQKLLNILTVGQFAVATSLLLFLITIIFQMDFVNSADLGFQSERIIVIKAPENNDVSTHLNFYKTKFLEANKVEDLSVGGFASSPGTTEPFASPLWIGEGSDKRQLIIPNIVVDKSYPAVLGLQLKAGKTFADLPEGNIKGNVLVNEAFAKAVGMENPIGQKVNTYGGEGVIIGVIKDFHFKSLHNPIEPFALFGMDDAQPDPKYFFMKVRAKNFAGLQVTWQKLFPDTPIDYFFLDEFFQAQYKADENLRLLLLYFTCLTIVISSSGLFGLMVHTIGSRTHEIGIRKVLGAGMFSLIRLMSASYIKLVAVGLIIGVITGIHVADKWLRNFVYRIEISWFIVLAPVFIITLLLLCIIGFKTYWSASSNPVDILQNH
jgi:putative ABC transport system permease protein